VNGSPGSTVDTGNTDGGLLAKQAGQLCAIEDEREEAEEGKEDGGGAGWALVSLARTRLLGRELAGRAFLHGSRV
jgi:hypothetical protein